MASKTPRLFWNKAYTHKQLMTESRWLLIVMALSHIGLGAYLFSQVSANEDAQSSAVAYAVAGVIFAVAGIVSSFWFRLVCITVWVLDRLYMHIARPEAGTLIIIVLLAVFIYKMIKYRGVQEEPSEKKGDESNY